MYLSDNPQDFLSYWTSKSSDRRSKVTLESLLAFTSGFTTPPSDKSSCVFDASVTIDACVREIYADGIEVSPGTAFYYGDEHMHIAARMAEVATGRTWPSLFRAQIGDRLGLSNSTRFVLPSTQNPRAGSGAEATAKDYALVLKALLAGQIIDDLDGFIKDRTANVTFGFRPDAVAVGQDWHYGLGFWRECDQARWTQSCDLRVVISSTGANGWAPWIDFEKGYFALIATEQTNGAPASTDLEQKLQPLIEAVLD